MKIFFDVDGVIMDNIHMTRGWIKRWDETMKLDIGIDPEIFSEIFKDWFPLAQTGLRDFEKEMAKWLKFHDYDAKAWQVINYWNEKDTNVNHAVYDTIQKLSRVENVALYVATNQTHERAWYLHDVFGFKDYFTDIYYSARLGCLKENPDYFAKIEKELDVDPHIDPPLYFDDDPKNIAVASARGWDAVFVETGDDVVNHPAVKALLEA